MHARSRTALAALALTLAAVWLRLGAGGAAEPAKDAWVGEYREFAGEGKDHSLVTITKDDGCYRVKGPRKYYSDYRFVEDKPGVLSDEKHVLGSIYLGEMKFSDKFTRKVLRVEFCYEHFYLHGD
jgi:hypothetical protein